MQSKSSVSVEMTPNMICTLVRFFCLSVVWNADWNEFTIGAFIQHQTTPHFVCMNLCVWISH